MAKSKKTTDVYDEQLNGWVISEVYIECSKCKKGDGGMGMDELEAEEQFYYDGWRSKYDMCYCPRCAKKYKIK